MVKLSDAVEVMHQGINTAADKVVYTESGIPIIQSKHLKNNSLDFSGVKYLGSDDVKKYSEKYVPKKDDLLFSNIGTIGKSVIVRSQSDFMFAWNVFVIRPKKKIIDVTYLKYYLDRLLVINYYDKFLTGGTVKFVNKKVMGGIEIPLPYPGDPEKSLKEQKRIAAILDKADGIRRKRKQAIQLADDFLRSVFLDMFGDPVTNPKGWEVKKFCEICKCSQGIQVDTELQSNEPNEGYSPFLRIVNYTQNSKEMRFIPTPETNKAKIRTDDVVMVRYGATAGFVGRGLEGVLANNLFKVGFNTEYLTSDFLFYLLTSDYFQDILISSRKGGAMPAISFGQLNNINITVPSLDKQKEFSKLLKLNTVMLNLSREALVEPLFDSLNQKAFKGEL
jgi:type I restriction enzyme S subunit